MAKYRKPRLAAKLRLRDLTTAAYDTEICPPSTLKARVH